MSVGLVSGVFESGLVFLWHCEVSQEYCLMLSTVFLPTGRFFSYFLRLLLHQPLGVVFGIWLKCLLCVYCIYEISDMCLCVCICSDVIVVV